MVVPSDRVERNRCPTLDPLGILVGMFAIAFGVLGVIEPYALVELRHPETEPIELGAIVYRVGGVICIFVGVWIAYAWDDLGAVARL